MSVLKASNAPIARDVGKPRLASDGPTPWVRPSDWLSINTPSTTEQKFTALVAVFNNSSNYIAFSMAVSSSGQYTVDWGDGTTTDYANAALAEKNYVWSNVSSTTLTSNGYRQVVINVTPKTAGTAFTSIDLGRVYSSAVTSASGQNIINPWLDIAVAASSATAMRLGGNSAGGSQVSFNTLLEQAVIVSHSMSSYAYLFAGSKSLQNVQMVHPNLVTNTNYMFNNCSSLRTAPFFNMSSVTTATGMFLDCTSLTYVPAYKTSSVRLGDSMFNGCSSLSEAPNIDTSSMTTVNSLFSSCFSIKKYPLYNFSSATNMSNCFSSNTSLIEIADISSSSATNMSGMFQNSPILKKIPSSITTNNAINLSNFVSTCTKLATIHSLSTSSCTNFSNMFQACRSLSEIPDIDCSKASSASNGSFGLGSSTTISALGNVKKVVMNGSKWTNSLENCTLGSTELNNYYTGLATLNPSLTSASGNGTTVTYTVGTSNISPFVAARTVTITGVSPVAYNLTNAVIASVNSATGTFTVTNAASGAYVSGGVATIQDNKTITVTNNPGTSADDPTIATNKGWTVTG